LSIRCRQPEQSVAAKQRTPFRRERDGAAAFRMGTEISRVLANGTNWLMVPRTVKLVIKGVAKPGVHARDIGFVIGAKLAAPADQGGFDIDIDYRILEFAGDLDQFSH
jgi:3-isopropylmalate/(R)-2-methylmalate dehydratase large subunit